MSEGGHTPTRLLAHVAVRPSPLLYGDVRGGIAINATRETALSRSCGRGRRHERPFLQLSGARSAAGNWGALQGSEPYRETPLKFTQLEYLLLR